MTSRISYFLACSSPAPCLAAGSCSYGRAFDPHFLHRSGHPRRLVLHYGYLSLFPNICFLLFSYRPCRAHEGRRPAAHEAHDQSVTSISANLNCRTRALPTRERRAPAWHLKAQHITITTDTSFETWSNTSRNIHFATASTRSPVSKGSSCQSNTLRKICKCTHCN